MNCLKNLSKKSKRRKSDRNIEFAKFLIRSQQHQLLHPSWQCYHMIREMYDHRLSNSFVPTIFDLIFFFGPEIHPNGVWTGSNISRINYQFLTKYFWEVDCWWASTIRWSTSLGLPAKMSALESPNSPPIDTKVTVDAFSLRSFS